MTKRQHLLEQIKLHAYNGDDELAIRVYCENRISYQVFSEQVALGRRLRKAADEKKGEQ